MDPAPVADLIAVLERHAPFDAMGAPALRGLAAKLRLAYYARGETLTGPEHGAADRLYILKQGRVRGAPPDAPEAAVVALGEGECFPVGALLGRRAPSNRYLAHTDCFCWELQAADFHALVESDAAFRAYCIDRMASLLDASYRAQRAESAAEQDERAGMLAPIAGAMARAPVSCLPGTPVGEVIAAMQERRIGSMVVAGPDGVPLGIFTVPDVLSRVALPQAPLDTPIERLMTAPPVCLEEGAPLVEAMLAMARHGIRHVVATRDGRLSGVLSERDLFALQRVGLRRTTERIHAAQSVAQLAEAAADVRGLARGLLRQGLDAEQVTRASSALNDALSARLIALTAARHALPAHWCWLALGSEGRMEQTPATDQDNALLHAGGAADRGALLAFAGEVNEGLAACGFPLCKGDIMARNPRWCLDLEAWTRLFDDWIRNPVPEALLHASVFFDFRPIAGDAALAGRLRAAVLARSRANVAFARAMSANALQSAPPLGVVRDFAHDSIDLKGEGSRLFTDAARIFALSRGLGPTGTADRLRAAAAAGALPGGEAQAAVQAFHFIQGLRLRRQHLEGETGAAANRIGVDRLNEVDRRMLKTALQQARQLQQRLRLDYAL